MHVDKTSKEHYINTMKVGTTMYLCREGHPCSKVRTPEHCDQLGMKSQTPPDLLTVSYAVQLLGKPLSSEMHPELTDQSSSQAPDTHPATPLCMSLLPTKRRTLVGHFNTSVWKRYILKVCMHLKGSLGMNGI